MPKRSVLTDKAPRPLANFSQAVVANGIVYVAGVASRDPTTGAVVGDTIEEQAELSFRNVRTILEEAGSSLDNAIRIIVYLGTPDHFAAFNEVWNRHVTAPDPPSRAVFIQPCFGLEGMLVEVVVTALAE